MNRSLQLGAVVLLLSLAAMARPEPPESAMGTSRPVPEVARPVPVPPASPVVSLSPVMRIFNGSPHQHQRLGEAVVRFVALGLPLPDLQVHFAPDTNPCHGYMGMFEPQRAPWRITICSEAGFVYEHELAHAWELANLEDQTRVEFMELRGYSAWSGSVPWNQRGVEGAAFVIQQGLSGLPLPPALGTEARSGLEAFELLTGQPAPRLVEWIESREVSCSDRPTALSRSVADAAGNGCKTSTVSVPARGGLSGEIHG